MEYDKSGNPELAKWRKKKLRKEIKELNNAELYALLAKRDGLLWNKLL